MGFPLGVDLILLELLSRAHLFLGRFSSQLLHRFGGGCRVIAVESAHDAAAEGGGGAPDPALGWSAAGPFQGSLKRLLGFGRAGFAVGSTAPARIR